MLRCRVTWSGGAGGPWLTNLYTSADNTQTFADTFRDAINTLLNSYRSLMRSGVNITASGVDEMLLDGTLVGSRSFTTPINLTSNGAGNWLPRECQGLAVLRTGVYVAGREVRGRLYLPQPTVGQADAGGDPSGTFQSTMNTALTTYRLTSGTPPCIWSKAHGVISPIQSAVMAPYFAVQRRRRD